jgi:hypothetical protein
VLLALVGTLLFGKLDGISVAACYYIVLQF